MSSQRTALVLPALLAVASSAGCPGCTKSAGSSPTPSAPRPALQGRASSPPARGCQGIEPIAPGVLYQVGPQRKYHKIGQVARLLRPGDVVRVDGDATYAEDVKLREAGTADRRITLCGVRVNGRRPVLEGTRTAVELAGDHTLLEGFEVTGGSSRCVFHHADDITIRDTVVHDCPSHGILSADEGSGSLTLDYVEVFHAGAGEMKHAIYAATDEMAHPGAVFRMQHAYVHDGRGGNAVKSRAERNEIAYNWIEGATYDELGLYGPDGQDEHIAREDSDVVGNVICKRGGSGYIARLGGDGTGQSWGRYRFVNNTFVLSSGAAGGFRITFGIDALELHNNVFYRVGGGGVTVAKDTGTWQNGHQTIAGSNNLLPPGSRLTNTTPLPASWSATLVKDNPGLSDLLPPPSSPLVNPATPLYPLPRFLPPLHTVEAVGTAKLRLRVDTIGAFER